MWQRDRTPALGTRSRSGTVSWDLAAAAASHLGTNNLQAIVGRDLEQDDAEVQERLARVELVLCDPYVFQEAIGESVGDVSAFELIASARAHSRAFVPTDLEDVEAEEEQRHDDEVELASRRALLFSRVLERIVQRGDACARRLEHLLFLDRRLALCALAESRDWIRA